MIKPVFTILILLLASLVAAQNARTSSSQKSRPDFSGKWLLDLKESSLGKISKPANGTLLVVQHHEPVIKLLEDAGGTDEKELIYYSDGRGEENPSEISIHMGQGNDSGQSDQKLESKSKWDGEKLVARAMLQRVVNGHQFRMEVVKEWKLSKDGNTLTITLRKTNLNSNALTNSMSVRSDMTSESKKVYRRDSTERTK